MTSMITPEQIDALVNRGVDMVQPERIVLFGSHARGDARADDSDLDLLIIESEAKDRAGEMVRLRRLIRPLGIPVDIRVYSKTEVEQWGKQPGTALFWALRESKVVYG
jgi:predicted nucleotidyltransferase